MPNLSKPTMPDVLTALGVDWHSVGAFTTLSQLYPEMRGKIPFWCDTCKCNEQAPIYQVVWALNDARTSFSTIADWLDGKVEVRMRHLTEQVHLFRIKDA